MGECNVFGCKRTVSKAGHLLCYEHWKAERDGLILRCETCGKHFEKGGACLCQPSVHSESPDALLSSTKIGEHFGISATRVNLILAELGWIEKYVKGWQLTEHGRKLGGQCREARQTGIPYVVWTAGILENKVLVTSVREQQGTSESQPEPMPEQKPKEPAKLAAADDFRAKFPANHRAADGHFVRSRAEMLIDNWLYMQGIVHAVERKLPIEEEMYCDFYLPKGKVYIEFWGMEKDPRYLQRKGEKKALYEKYKLNLVELNDSDILNLDDVLPRMLLRYSIDCT